MSENKLVILTKIEQQLGKVRTIDEAKNIRDQAEALRVYAKSAKKGLMIQNRAAAIKILAEQRAGQLISNIPKVQGARKGQKGLLFTLNRSQISQPTAHRWQAMSTLPKQIVQELEVELTEEGKELTSSLIFNLARKENAPDPPTPIVTPGFPDGPFRTIILDPPWPIEKIILDFRPAERETMDYATMSLDDIKALPVARLADERGAHIYLWTTHKFLPFAFELFEAWGVRYECLLTWKKPIAKPVWWRYNTEHALFGKVGSLAPLKKGMSVGFDAPQQGHSHKPEIFYQIVRSVSPEPRLTMFDEKRDGFIAWGVMHQQISKLSLKPVKREVATLQL